MGNDGFDVRQWMNQFQRIVAQACLTTTKDRRNMFMNYNVILPKQFITDISPKQEAFCDVINTAIPVVFELTNINKKIDKAVVLEPIIYFGLLLADAVLLGEELTGIYNQFKIAIFRASYMLGFKEVDVGSGDLMKEFGFGDPPPPPEVNETPPE